jgi:polysaccharide export outer membrane protein
MTAIATLLIAFTLNAQAKPAQTPPAAAAPQQAKPDQAPPPAHYTLGPQDQLRITVFDEPELTNLYRVDSDGYVAFPLINRIEASGLTVTEFALRLRTRLAAGFLNNPQVRVDIEAYKSQFIFVGGEVRAPARIPLSGSMTLPEALAQAGSTLQTAANEVVVTHAKKPNPDGSLPEKDAGSVRVSLNDLQLGKAGQDIFLQDGDTVFVPKAQRFYISGQVRNGGTYIIEPGMTVAQALALAGGLNDRGSDRRIEATRVIDGKSRAVHLKLTDKVLPDDNITVGGRIF